MVRTKPDLGRAVSATVFSVWGGCGDGRIIG